MNKKHLILLLMMMFGVTLLIMAVQITYMKGSKSEVATFLRKADKNLRAQLNIAPPNKPATTTATTTPAATSNTSYTLDDIKYGNISDYKMIKSVGKGAFANVWEATHIPTGDKVAMKILAKGGMIRSLGEYNMFQELKEAPNLLAVRDVLKGDKDAAKGNITLVFDFMAPQDFKDLLKEVTPFKIKLYIYQVLRTLEFAHSKNIMHRDIKPLNVIMDPKDLTVKVIDWNHAEHWEAGKNWTVRISTLNYKAPELLINNTYYTPAIDVWATGITLAELMFKKPSHVFASQRLPPKKKMKPLDAKWLSFRNQLDAIAMILGSEGLFEYAYSLEDDSVLPNIRDVDDHPKGSWTQLIDPDNEDLVDPLGIDLLGKMVVWDPKDRLTCTEALKHPYFDDVRSWNHGDNIPE